MKQFSEIINVDGRELFFVFSRLRTSQEDKFFVVVTRDALTYSVDLKKNTLGKWQIVSPSPPNWFKRIEAMIVQIINDNTEQDDS
jgi:hypothetical protein